MFSQAWGILDRFKQSCGCCSTLSRIEILEAPASTHIFATSSTTSGCVVEAPDGPLAKLMLGLITTLLPGLTKRFIPPRASTALLVIADGLRPRLTTTSG